MDEQGMKARIQQLIDHQHMTRQSFAEHIGVSPATLSQILNEKQKPSLTIVTAIMNRFPSLRYEWLLDGKEPMFADGTTSKKTSTESPQQGGEPLLFGNETSTPPHPTGNPTSNHAPLQTVAAPPQMQVKYIDKPQRKITEIRIFYDDQTWETFVPKNK